MKNKFFGGIPHYTKFILSIYILALLFLTVMRVFMLKFVMGDSIRLTEDATLQGLRIGMQFDTVVLAYILALPILLLFIHSISGLQKKSIVIFVSIFLSVAFLILAIIVIADIPYFDFFKNRLTESSLQWMGTPDIVLGMLIGNTTHLLFLIAGLIIATAIGFFLYRFCRLSLIGYNWKKKHSNWVYAVSFLCLALLCFLGMRGKLSHPIRQGDAFYCEDPVLNQIGLNPAFTILKSYTDKVKLMDEATAIRNTQRLLSINQPIKSISPIAREVKGKGALKKHNIVLVLMEGMSAHNMNAFGNTNNLTPTLDSLAKKSWFFTNAYSAGIHTNNGIFSSLFAFPSMKRVRPMSTVPARTYSGFPYTLKKLGYINIFFSPHSGGFDNMNVFLPNNFFDRLYTEDEYPRDKVLGIFGVPDDFMFSYATNEINKLDTSKAFFATILTASNHSPYILPSYFKHNYTNKSHAGVSYADWSIQQFLNQVKNQKWFSNTIFVFVADHGLNIGESAYDLVLSYNHIPIIIYAPEILGEPKTMEGFTGQIDLFPTLMGILNADYINNTLGVDAINQKREAMYFSADDKFGCINNEWLYVHRYSGGESLYKYRTNSTEDFSKTNPEVFLKLKEYSSAQLQVAEYIFSNNKSAVRK